MKISIVISFLCFSGSAFAQSQPPQFTISTVAGAGTAGYYGDGGPATSALLNNPLGVALDSAGNRYIADFSNNRIRKVSANGTITTFAGTGIAGFSGDGGLAVNARLNGPIRVSCDAAGDIFIADSLNNRIRKVAPNGIITTVAGSGGAGYSGDGGAATSALLNNPTDANADAAGNLFIADEANNAIRKVDTNGIITTVVGTGTAGYAGDGGPATKALLNGPVIVILNAGGDLFISDQNNERVRKVSNGVITTVAGNGKNGFAGDGATATSAELSAPTGLGLDAGGDLFIADQGNNRIRVLLANGTIWTIAGTGSPSYSGDGGPALSAALNDPRDLAVSGGLVYVADSDNARIRLLTPVPLPPSVNPGGIVPIYSSLNTIQPGEWVSLYGTNLATGTAVWNGDFPILLGGTSVTINAKPAYLWFVSPTQINLQAPDDTTTGVVKVVVTTPNGTATSTVTLAPYAPSFSLLSAKYPAAIVLTPGAPGNSGGGYDIIGPAGAFSYATRPVKPGETLVLYGVGFGPTTPTVLAGQAYSGAAPAPVLPQVTIGGVPALVQFAGIVEAGLFQLNVVVPAVATGDQLLVANINGVATQDNIYVTLQ